MVRNWALGLTVAALLCAAFWWLFGGDRDLRQITRQSDKLAAALHKDSGDGLLGIAARSHEIADFFAKKITLTPGDPLPGIGSREELITVAATTLQAASSLTVKILDREVNWVEPHIKASMHVAVEVRVALQGEVQKIMHTYELTWMREDERWVIASAQLSENIRRTGSSDRR